MLRRSWVLVVVVMAVLAAPGVASAEKYVAG